MKHIYLNLKRFDVPAALGGVNRIAPIADWAETIIAETRAGLAAYDAGQVDFTMFFPELHLLSAAAAAKDTPIQVGCEGVYRGDVTPGGNFGAFTTKNPAAAAAAAGAKAVIIGHCEERNDLNGILAAAGVDPFSEAAVSAVNGIFNQEILAAQARGLSVLYCIGEKAEEQERWQEVLGAQLALGLKGTDTGRIVIAYEPVWSIGPGRTPADRDYITKIARFVKEKTGGLDVVYGGGLKTANAAMLASIPEIDGGLIALTRFTGEIGFYPDEYLKIIRLYLTEKGLAQ